MDGDGRETVEAWLARPGNEEELLRVLRSKLWGLRDRMPGVAPEEDARALLVEVVQGALETANGFDPARGTSVKGWLLGVANKIVLRWQERSVREGKRRIEAPGGRHGNGDESPGDLHERLLGSLPSDDSVEGTVVGEAWLEAVLAQCSEPDRELLVCLYVERRTPEETAERLGTTTGNVRIRRMRALNKLRERLGEDDLIPAARRGYGEFRGWEGGAR